MLQAVGIFGMLCAIISYQCKSNRNYFVWQGLSAVFFSLQFVLMGAWAGLLFNAFNIVRAAVYRISKLSRSIWTVVLFEIYIVAATLISIFLFYIKVNILIVIRRTTNIIFKKMCCYPQHDVPVHLQSPKNEVNNLRASSRFSRLIQYLTLGVSISP